MLAAWRQALTHVYWIGGGSGAGKSAVACRLAAERGFVVYATDEVMSDHARRLSPEEAPYLAQFIAMDMDERWVNRSPEVMLDTFHWFRGEGFELIVEDLLAMPPSIPVVAEGFRLLPHLVQPLLADPSHAIWLLPSSAFRRAAIDARGDTWTIPNRTTNPQRARQNLGQRERMFIDRLTAETQQLGLPTLHLDAGLTEDEQYRRVTHAFGLA